MKERGMEGKVRKEVKGREEGMGMGRVNSRVNLI